MCDWREEFRKVLAGRKLIPPADLPPFGSLILTNSGHTAEIVGWFGPAADPAAPFAIDRVAFVLIFKDPLAYTGMYPVLHRAHDSMPRTAEGAAVWPLDDRSAPHARCRCGKPASF